MKGACWWSVCAGLLLLSGCTGDRLRGTIVFQSNRDGNFEIYTMSADGSNQKRLTNSPSSDFSPRWSPDGSQIAFASDRDGNWEIYTIKRDGSDLRRLTDGQGTNTAPSWSADGRRVLFISTRDVIYGEVYSMKPDGSNVERLTRNESVKDTPVMSADGKTIYLTLNDRQKMSIGAYSRADSTMRRVSPEGSNSINPHLRPDGSYLLYVSNQEGAFDLFSQPTGGGAAERITSDRAIESSGCWTSDPRRILVAKNYCIYLLSLDTHSETLLSGKGDSAPDWSSHDIH